MPRTPIDYSKSVIYKIQHLEKDELVYVGSTTNFVKRKNQHKSQCKTKTQKVYEMIRENGGWECFNMIIIKEYPCQTKIDLVQEEDRVMRELNTSLNMYRSYLSPEKKIEYTKEYYKTKKEEFKKHNNEYYEKNKEHQKEKAKEYRKQKKEQISKQKKEAYQKKKINAINLKK